MGGYPGVLPVELSRTSPVREFGFGELVLSTAPISRGSCGSLLQSGRVVGHSWQNCWSEISLGPDRIALWHWCCFRGTVVGSLGILIRLPVLSLGDS